MLLCQLQGMLIVFTTYISMINSTSSEIVSFITDGDDDVTSHKSTVKSKGREYYRGRKKEAQGRILEGSWKTDDTMS